MHDTLVYEAAAIAGTETLICPGISLPRIMVGNRIATGSNV